MISNILLLIILSIISLLILKFVNLKQTINRLFIDYKEYFEVLKNFANGKSESKILIKHLIKILVQTLYLLLKITLILLPFIFFIYYE